MLIGFYWFTLGLTGFYLVLPSFIGRFWRLQGRDRYVQYGGYVESTTAPPETYPQVSRHRSTGFLFLPSFNMENSNKRERYSRSRWRYGQQCLCFFVVVKGNWFVNETVNRKKSNGKRKRQRDNKGIGGKRKPNGTGQCENSKKRKREKSCLFFVYCRNVGCAVCKILQMTRR